MFCDLAPLNMSISEYHSEPGKDVTFDVVTILGNMSA